MKKFGKAQTGFLVLESGECFQGEWRGGKEQAGEVVFNTSHSGYEEIATDPSYFSQIMVMTAPMQGNYGADPSVWESKNLWISGFVCVEMQESTRDRSWLDLLEKSNVPVLSDIDTREVVLKLREIGTPWGAIVKAENKADALKRARELIVQKKTIDTDWVYAVTRKQAEFLKGHKANGPRVAILDYGCKENTIRELQAACSEVAVFPSRTPAKVIRDWSPSGILLSNGPGDPALVQESVATVKELLGEIPVFGICMGNQILGLALGAKTYKLKFGHRGSNHPVRDLLLDEIYVTSQNHGYVVDPKTLPSDVRVSHWNLNDETVEGIECKSKKCFSVQYHPESHPGPREARRLFDYFLSELK